MATNFPTSLDALANPTSSNKLSDAGVLHADQHANANDAIEALQAKVGINSSAVTTSLDYKVTNLLAPKASPSFTGTVTMSGPQFLTGGVTYVYQPAITTNSTTGAQTLTIANLLTEIINYTGAGITTMTLPTGTLMDGGISGIVSNVAFDWSIVNTTANIITMAAGATHTYVGNLSVAANVSARFRSVRTAATTWVTYRIS